MEHFWRAVADWFDTALVVSDPSYNVLSVARESTFLARPIGIKNRILFANCSGAPEDLWKVREICGEEELFFKRSVYSG